MFARVSLDVRLNVVTASQPRVRDPLTDRFGLDSGGMTAWSARGLLEAANVR